MAFFSKLKRLFGFGPSGDDELLQDTADSQDACDGGEAADPSVSRGPSAPDQPDEEPELDQDIRRKIFEHVVEVFNGAMPQFIRDSVDPNAQTDYIYRTLDDSVKEYFDTMDQRMQRKAERAYNERNAKLNDELDRLRRQSQVLEDERTTLRERQLSADRQRRALNDRVKDLEQKVAALDADREQLQLENRSLLNKLRLQSVDHPTGSSSNSGGSSNSNSSNSSGSGNSGSGSSGSGNNSGSNSSGNSSSGNSSGGNSSGGNSSGSNSGGTVSGADSPRLQAGGSASCHTGTEASAAEGGAPLPVPTGPSARDQEQAAQALAAQQAAEQAAAAATERAVKLSAKLDKVTDERNTAREALKQLEAEHTQLQATLQPLTVDNAKLHEAMKKQADMHRISEAMMGDLRRSAALSREELNNERRRAADLEAQLEATADLRQQLQQARQRTQELEDIHTQAASLRDALEQERSRVADLERQVQAGDQTEALTARCKQLEADLSKTRRRLTQAEALLAEVADATDAAEPNTTYQSSSNTDSSNGSNGSHGSGSASCPSATEASAVEGGAPLSVLTGPSARPAGARPDTAPHISEAALQAMEANFSDENWRTEHLLTDPDPAPKSPSKRRSRPSKRSNNDDNPQLSLF